MITLFLVGLSIVYVFTGIGNLSIDTQAIVITMCIASDLNLLSGIWRK
jgi:hypothetical protein